jgi:hypothetical protein
MMSHRITRSPVTRRLAQAASRRSRSHGNAAYPRRADRLDHPPNLRLRLLAALSSQPDHRATMTYEVFLAWADEDTQPEWVDGVIIMPSPANIRHQRITQFVSTLMVLFVEKPILARSSPLRSR